MPDISSNNIPLMNEIVSAALARGCLKDEKFRENLEAGNMAAIIGGEGAAVLEKNNIAVRTVHNTADTVHIALPCYEALDEAWMEMTDEQLQKISGGAFEVVAVCTVIGVGVSVTLGFLFGEAAVITSATVLTAVGAGVLIGVAATLAGSAAIGIGVGVHLHLAGQDQNVNVGLAS
ncbi:MAG: class IIb bacteriocin, lactobin A/cerein 7B family [Gammaproteobacteria bacterium]|nr:class IIb bacteriocin, lactobin A/cerein 7B family [Gammaproteobacteria bacterium]